MKKLFIELFAGSAEFCEEAKIKGFETIAIDWKQYGKINKIMDIENLTYEDIKDASHVHASFDCKTYSQCAISTHRRNSIEPISKYAVKCDRVNSHVISLIEKKLSEDPNFTFTFENPRANLRHMPFMQKFKRYTVWYCKYGDDRAKPTDIWTNLNWTPRPECKNYKYDKEGNIINKHCHHQSARRGARTGTQGRKNSYEASKIPKELMNELLNCISNK